MFDLNRFVKLKENNQLEVKQSFQGIPNSIWETYSAFCNSYGGIILLGVGEDKHKKLFTCGLTENQANNFLKSFWDTINNKNKVSINLLSDKDVQIQQINNDFVVVISVPQADKLLKPIYINNNPLFAFRRNHEGDYRCTKIEIQAMLRDQSEQSNDSYMIEEMDLSIINQDTLAKYRTAYNQYHKEDHPFVKDDNENFLIHIGAAKRDINDIVHPTKAGLLMFGNFYDITNVYPNYFLDYQDHRNLEGDDMRWSFRITSTNGDWSGNLYDFYYRIIFKLTEDIAVPFKMNGMFRDDSSLMKKAIREALCNTLSNADYHGELGLVIKQYHDKLVFSNPGVLAIPLNKILLGGTSKARNRTILNIFSYVNIGERAGSGYPLILNATKEGGYPTPELYDEFNPDGTKLIIFIKKIILQDENVENEDKNLPIQTENLPVETENLPIQTENLPVQTENLPVQMGNLPIQTENLPIETENLPINIINNTLYKNDVKIKLVKIFTELKNELISRKVISNLLSTSDKTSYNLILYLLDLGLIEPVIGYGKGKYKFK